MGIDKVSTVSILTFALSGAFAVPEAGFAQEQAPHGNAEISGNAEINVTARRAIERLVDTNTSPLNQDQGAVSKVEILEGPLGAPYGRNAAVGAIEITTARPTDVLSGSVKARNWSIMAFANNFFGQKYGVELFPATEFGGNFLTPGARACCDIELSYRL